MKILRIVRLCLYICASILIFIFHESLMDYINYIVGGAMILYGIEDIIISIIHHKIKELDNRLFSGIILFVLAGLTIFVCLGDVVRTSVIWAIWSILREAREIEEDFHNIMHHKAGIIDMIESSVIIVFSITLVLSPTLEHMHIHLILLGVELITKVTFPIMDELLNKYFYDKIYRKEE